MVCYTGQTAVYLVKRLIVLNGICPGGHQDHIENDIEDDESVMETCKAYNMFSACQDTFSCECPDYAIGNDCKHILIGALCLNNVILILKDRSCFCYRTMEPKKYQLPQCR